MPYLLSAALVNCVHDEFLVECGQEDVVDVAAAVKQEMERAMAAVVPRFPPRPIHTGEDAR